MEKRVVESDVLIIGGGTAGCYAAIRLGKEKNLKVTVVDKADIKRSGCLAAGVNALNAYITEGHVPMDYVKYAVKDAEGIAREDLLLDICERLNSVTADMEKRGLTILKDSEGKYVSRGWRNLKINGENIKPILAENVYKQENVQVFDHINITDLRLQDGAKGAFGFGINDGIFYEFRAKAVLIATGGAAGLYRPNNEGDLSHQMWYCPFNTGAGYAMGIMAGAEMTTLEMRFIALRCKDTIAPTGTLAQGAGAKQVNSKGEIYEDKYGLTTSQRLWGTVEEDRAGRGPCYLKTVGIDDNQEQELLKAYLNMAPVQTLKWIDSGEGPSKANVEIEGTEPYIVGGHTAGGFWVDRERQTNVSGLFAAGDVAGGAPQKYVTGALAEGEIAAEGIIKYLDGLNTNNNYRNDNDIKNTNCNNVDRKNSESKNIDSKNAEKPGRINNEYKDVNIQSDEKKKEYESYLKAGDGAVFAPSQLEKTMQKVMDEYAGGIKTGYKYNEEGLKIARRKIDSLLELIKKAGAKDLFELKKLYEVRERLIVSRVLIEHLSARKETRWHGFQENSDFPERNEEFNCYINSVFENGEIRIIKRDPVRL